MLVADDKHLTCVEFLNAIQEISKEKCDQYKKEGKDVQFKYEYVIFEIDSCGASENAELLKALADKGKRYPNFGSICFIFPCKFDSVSFGGIHGGNWTNAECPVGSEDKEE